jgi:hypothetical protein
MIITKHPSDDCQLQTQGPQCCLTCHCPIGHPSSVTGKNSLFTKADRMCACVAGGGFLCTFDFLTSTSLQSQGYVPPLCSPFMCAIFPARNTPLTQSSIRSYACAILAIGSTNLASAPRGIYCFTEMAYPLSCPGQLSLNYPSAVRTPVEPTCRYRPLASVCQPFCLSSRSLSLSLRNTSITFACLAAVTKFSFSLSPPRLRQQ